MEVILTGSSGFVGQNLISYLSRTEFLIKTISRHALSMDNLVAYGSIIHLAGKAHDLKKTSNAHEYYQVNYELTKKLYDSFLRSDAEKFIFISSVKATADIVNNILTEEVEPNPQTHYGKSKLMAEQYIQQQPLPIGKHYYILRPCMIHGPGNKGNLNLLHRFVEMGVPYPLAAFENKRSFLSVENLCFVIKELIERGDIPSGIYQIADDEALSTNEVVSILAQAIGKKARLWSIPCAFVKAIAKVGEILRLPLSTERLKKLTENYIVSNHKIKATLGKPLPLSAREGLKITANSFDKS